MLVAMFRVTVMSAEMTLTTSLIPDYRYQRIRFIFLHLNTASDHSRQTVIIAEWRSMATYFAETRRQLPSQCEAF